MKKFTLLAVAAMFAGTAFAQTELNGIKISEGKDTTAFNFYRIKNMRAMRLDYTSGVLMNRDGDTVSTDRGGFYMSETLSDGETPTPKIADTPYMGLSNMGGNWWLSYASDDEIKSPLTEFWYFTTDKKFPGQLKIKNAVIDGSVSTIAKKANDFAGYNRSNMDFNSKNNFYYVLPVKPAFAVMDTKDPNVNWTDSILKHLTPEEFDMAFAFSLKDSISDQNGYKDQCLDMNNYVNVMVRIPQLDENGDTVTNNGNPVYYRYGFAGVDRTWSPVTVTSNKNHWENNGSIFFVEPASTEDALKAKEEYSKIVAEGFRKGAIDNAKYCFANTVNSIAGWLNVPALFSETAMAQLKTIQKYCESWDGEGVDLDAVHDPDTRDAYVEAVQKMADAKLVEAAALIGNGCKVRFQNQLALRDLDKFINEGDAMPEEYQLGNAYLAAGGDPTYKYGGAVFHMGDDDNFEDVHGTGVEPRLEADEECEWELIPVPGTVTFLLYNAANDCYIRKYHDLFDYCGGEDNFGVAEDGVSEISWMTTTEKDDAAPFTFIACPNEEGQPQPSDEQLELMMAADLDTGVENKVRLQSKYTQYIQDPNTGKYSATDFSQNIHRGSLGSEYKFINWGYTTNNWFADTNAFLIESIEMGGINEIAAEKAVKATGIYDLQGRRVSKADKGVYIINGVKTVVR